MRVVVPAQHIGWVIGTHRADLADRLVLVDITPRQEREGVDRIVGFMLDRAVEGFASLDEAADAVPLRIERLTPDERNEARMNFRTKPRIKTAIQQAAALSDLDEDELLAQVVPRRKSLRGLPFIDAMPGDDLWPASVVDPLAQVKIVVE